MKAKARSGHAKPLNIEELANGLLAHSRLFVCPTCSSTCSRASLAHSWCSINGVDGAPMAGSLLVWKLGCFPRANPRIDCHDHLQLSICILSHCSNKVFALLYPKLARYSWRHACNLGIPVAYVVWTVGRLPKPVNILREEPIESAFQRIRKNTSSNLPCSKQLQFCLLPLTPKTQATLLGWLS